MCLQERRPLSSVYAVVGDHNTRTRGPNELVHYGLSQCVAKYYVKSNRTFDSLYDWAEVTLKKRIKFQCEKSVSLTLYRYRLNSSCLGTMF